MPPDYRHDLFVSFAHVDDEPFLGIEHGWVSNLFLALHAKLQAARRGPVSVVSRWRSVNTGASALTPAAIAEELQRSATLLVVLSPGYLASDECRQELEQFLRQDDPNSPPSERVFVVEKQPVKDGAIPEPLAQCPRYRFWRQDERGRARTLAVPQPAPDDLSYYHKVQDLAGDLAATLARLRGAQTPPLATVYLAEVPEALSAERDGVKRYLEQFGIRVTPTQIGLRENPAALDRLLAEADLFVQLLGREADPEDRDWAEAQSTRARERGMPVWQWRPPAGLEEFKQRLRRHLTEPVPPPVAKRFVFLNANEDDHRLAHKIGRVISQMGLRWQLRSDRGRPGEVRVELTAKLRDCDALIVVYGEINPEWVRQQWVLYRRVERPRPAKALALYEGPPEDKPPVVLPIAVEILDCRRGLDEAILRRFLAPLLEEDAA